MPQGRSVSDARGMARGARLRPHHPGTRDAAIAGGQTQDRVKLQYLRKRVPPSLNAFASARAGYRSRPGLIDAFGELRALIDPWPHAEPGMGRLVMLIPGFMARDITLAPMAAFIRMTGHRPLMSAIWS